MDCPQGREKGRESSVPKKYRARSWSGCGGDRSWQTLQNKAMPRLTPSHPRVASQIVCQTSCQPAATTRVEQLYPILRIPQVDWRCCQVRCPAPPSNRGSPKGRPGRPDHRGSQEGGQPRLPPNPCARPSWVFQGPGSHQSGQVQQHAAYTPGMGPLLPGDQCRQWCYVDKEGPQPASRANPCPCQGGAKATQDRQGARARRGVAPASPRYPGCAPGPLVCQSAGQLYLPGRPPKPYSRSLPAISPAQPRN